MEHDHSPTCSRPSAYHALDELVCLAGELKPLNKSSINSGHDAYALASFPQLFASHIIKTTLPVAAPPGRPNFDPLYYVAGQSAAGTGIFKAGVYNATEPVPVSLRFEGIEGAGATANLTVLTGPADPYGYNDPFTRVNVVKETVSELTAGEGGVFSFSLPALSIAVLETADAIRVD